MASNTGQWMLSVVLVQFVAKKRIEVDYIYYTYVFTEEYCRSSLVEH